MSWVLGVIVVFMVSDAFDSDDFTAKQQWQVVVGIVIALIAVVLYYIESKEDE